MAGQFKNVNGVAAPYLVKINPTTGALITAFNPTPNGMVYDLELPRQHALRGGHLHQDPQPRPHQLRRRRRRHRQGHRPRHPFTAAVTGVTRVMRIDVSPDGTSLVAIGNFTQVGGQYRPNIVELDLTTSPALGRLLVHRHVPLRPLLVDLRHLHP